MIGYEIKDLYETDISLFQKEAAYWGLDPLVSETKISAIDTDGNRTPDLILGGPDIFKPSFSDSDLGNYFHHFERVYTGLPPHNYMTFVGKFWYFGDPLDVQFWGFAVSAYETTRLPLEPVKPVLGPSFKRSNFAEGRVYFDHLKRGFPHDDDTLVLSISVYTDNLQKRSIGFRDLTIHFSNYSGNKMNQAFDCHISEGRPNLFDNRPCKCPFNQGLNGSSICQNCSEKCASCYGAKPSQCVACTAEGRWNGAECSTCHWNCKTCTGLTEHECPVCNFEYYNYGNGSCLEACDWPFRVEFTGNEKKCVSPCSPGKYFLILMNQCVKECQPPMVRSTIENNIPICENPCLGALKFLYWNGTCLPFCLQPLIQVSNVYGNLCQNPCEGTSKYLYFNRSCLDSCPAPYEVRSEPDVKYCKHPCSNPQYYVYNNGSCHASCPSPLRVKVESGVKSCLPLCDMDKEYILKNGECSAECPSPLIQRTKLMFGRYCLSPCESDENFVGENGSCLLNCPSFFDVRIKYGVKYCLSPCLAGQYYFEGSKSCLDACSYPLKVTSEGGANFCHNTCSESNSFLNDDQSCSQDCPAPLIREEGETTGKYCRNPCGGERENKYLNLDGSCQEKCEYPYKIVNQNSYQMCLIDMSSTQIHQVKSIRQIVKNSNFISEVGGLLSCLVNTGDPTSIFMMPLLQMLEIIRYTDTPLPGNIEELSLNIERKTGDKRFLKSSSIRKMEDLQDAFDEQIRKVCVVSLITLLLSGILRVIAPIFKESKLFKSLQGWSLTLQWNLLAPVLVSAVEDVTLFSVMEIKSFGIRFESYRILISLFAMLPLNIFLIYKTFNISSEVKRIRENGPKEHLEITPSHLQKWRFTFEIYKSDRLYQRLFVLIYLIRVISVSIIIACLDKHPLLQAVCLVLISFGMISYLFCASPIQMKISHLQYLVVEIPVMLYNALLFALTVINETQNVDVDVKNALGQLMTLLFLTTPLLTSIIIVAKLLIQVYNLYKKRSSNIETPSGFIQLSEMSHDDDEEREEESLEQSHVMTVIVNENEDNNGKYDSFL